MHEFCNSINWSGWLSLSTTVVIGGIATCIAWQQSQTNKDKFRFDLYQKRFSVYESTLAYFNLIEMRNTSPTIEERNKIKANFIKSCRESQFLFDSADGIFKQLEEIRKSIDYIESKDIQSTAYENDPKMKKDHFNKHQGESLALPGKIKELETRLMKYLNFHKAR